MKKRTIVIVVAVIAVVIGVIAAVVGGILIGMAAVSFESEHSLESKHPHESKHSLKFQTMRFERSDSSSIKKILTLDRTDDGVVIALGYEDMMSQEQEISHQKEFDRETLEEIEAVLGDYQVRDWDGFSGTNPNGVYDGSSFVFSCTLTDGSSFYASGSNKYPKHYRSVYQYLEGLLWRVSIQDTTFETESYTIQLPESVPCRQPIAHRRSQRSKAVPQQHGEPAHRRQHNGGKYHRCAAAGHGAVLAGGHGPQCQNGQCCTGS